MKRTKSQSSYNQSALSVAEKSFTYFCKPLDTLIPPHRKIPIFIEQCVLAIEGMSPNGKLLNNNIDICKNGSKYATQYSG